MKIRADLHHEVEKLKTWLVTHQHVDHYDSWWTVNGIVDAVQNFLASVQAKDWTEEDVTNLLYVLEHSCTDHVAELFAQDESIALAIGKHSLARGGVASDDIAEQLGKCSGHREEAEALLIEFARDKHERTRRMALLSLAQLQSAAVPELAVMAWDAGSEPERIGALSALRTIGSDLLPMYIEKAKEDGRKHIAAYLYRSESGCVHPPTSNS